MNVSRTKKDPLIIHRLTQRIKTHCSYEEGKDIVRAMNDRSIRVGVGTYNPETRCFTINLPWPLSLLQIEIIKSTISKSNYEFKTDAQP